MMKEKIYQFERTFPISRIKAWELLADTEHVTRTAGRFPAEFSEVKYDDFLYRNASGKFKRIFELKWKELPYEWIRNYRRSNERRYEKRPVKSLIWQLQLDDAILPDGSAGTRLSGKAVFRYTNPLALPAIPLIALPPLKNIMDYIADYIELNKKSGPERLPFE